VVACVCLIARDTETHKIKNSLQRKQTDKKVTPFQGNTYSRSSLPSERQGGGGGVQKVVCFLLIYLSSFFFVCEREKKTYDMYISKIIIKYYL